MPMVWVYARTARGAAGGLRPGATGATACLQPLPDDGPLVARPGPRAIPTQAAQSAFNNVRGPQVRCIFTPCPLWYRAGEDRKAKVKDFLERCTETQRAHGLPPDGERVAMTAGVGRIFATVPAGLRPGDTFSAVVAANQPVLLVTVPEGAEAGQVIEVQRHDTTRPALTFRESEPG